MQIEKFNSLSMPQQYYYTTKCGTYLLSRHEKTSSIDLYEVCGYYVEICYQHGETNCSSIRSFRSFRFLDPYLSSINISDLFVS